LKYSSLKSLLIRHSKYSAMLSKVHSYRLLFRRFCPLGRDSRFDFAIRLWPFCDFCSF